MFKHHGLSLKGGATKFMFERRCNHMKMKGLACFELVLGLIIYLIITKINLIIAIFNIDSIALIVISIIAMIIFDRAVARKFWHAWKEG